VFKEQRMSVWGDEKVLDVNGVAEAQQFDLLMLLNRTLQMVTR
jgi:hypothetical protein